MIPVFDLHCDTPLNIKRKRFNHIKPNHLRPSIFSGIIFAHFIHPKEKEPFDAGVKFVLNTIHYLNDKQKVNIVYNFKKIHPEKTNVILGVEGGHIFDRNSIQFETLYELGVRVFTLTWNNSNQFAHSAFDNDKKGLTRKGREFIKFLKDYDILIDLSHASTRTVLEICEITDNMVFASHSCIRRLNPYVRNIDDQAIRAIVLRRGIVGINFSKKHLGEYSAIDHINYLYENYGIDSVGIGSDFDGITDPALNCPEGYKKIEMELKRNGFSDSKVEKIFYKNFLKILKRIYGVTSV
jgi:membrane dipeptidase